ncbi:MAG: hypothetical protein PHN44_02290, partial [Candidatus Marinimicrobia bacterium]|nr:hypothetical protein [Candidatus Neomarinimicrobiota bacterium]
MKRLLLIFVATLLIVGVVSATVTKNETTDGDYTVITWTTNLDPGSGGDNTTWDVPAGVTEVECLVVAGGGAGGGFYYGSGGGAGGIVYHASKSVSGSIAVMVGAGGTGVVNDAGHDGNNSTFSDIVANGGGGGGAYEAIPAGRNGGSVGGSGGDGEQV